jgi:hypothetical protein
MFPHRNGLETSLAGTADIRSETSVVEAWEVIFIIILSAFLLRIKNLMRFVD